MEHQQAQDGAVRRPAMRPIRLALSALALVVLAACTTIPDFDQIDRVPAGRVFPVLPAPEDPVWEAPRGLALNTRSLREGRRRQASGETFLLPYVLTRLPYRNIEETRAWLDHINASYQPDPPWRYRPEPRVGHYKCASTALSTTIDWYHIKDGQPLGSYRSWLHGRRQRGIDSRAVDAIYYRLASEEATSEQFPLLHMSKDPVEGNPLPISPAGFAAIATMPRNTLLAGETVIEAPDPTLPGVTHRLRRARLLDRDPVALVNEETVRELEAERARYEASLIDALHRDGALYGSIRLRQTFRALAPAGAAMVTDRLPLPQMAGHCVTIVGYARQSGATYFIYRETFGDFDEATEIGGPAYRVMPVTAFAQVYSFRR